MKIFSAPQLSSMDLHHRFELFPQYKNIQATKKEVLDVLEQYRALTYRLDNYVFNDGARKELLNLNGTIPVVYKSEIRLESSMRLMIHRIP